MAQKEKLVQLTDSNPHNLSLQMQDYQHQGWEIDEAFPFTDHFGSWTVGMFFNERRAHDIAERILNKRPKMTDRAEIMAKARASRGKNKEKEGEE